MRPPASLRAWLPYTGDLGVAEDVAHDAFVAALEQWPSSGTPRHPRAWLIAVGKRRFIDGLRRNQNFELRHGELYRQTTQRQATLDAHVDAVTEEISDDLLRLIFIGAVTPCFPAQARVAADVAPRRRTDDRPDRSRLPRR